MRSARTHNGAQGEESLEEKTEVTFAHYRLDLQREQLWSDDQTIPLPGKGFALLCYLVEHAGQLVSKAELFAALWPGTVVSDNALTFWITELRKALGDNAKTPQLIETVHRRGYRFIAPVTTMPPSVPRATFKILRSDSQGSGLSTQHSVLVGREAELAQLHTWLAKAANGERHLVFVTGEPGIGKTSLIAAWMARLADEHDLAIGYGQCIDHYGAGEAYLPLLSALGQLCRKPSGQQWIQLLSQHAPTWLAQMPALLSDDEISAVHSRTTGATKERMLRELVEAFAVLTTERTLVLVLEDLHWSDPSTLDFLAFLARSPARTRLLVLGTYRPVEMLNEKHPLKNLTHELYAHELARELSLSLLSEEDIAAYLHARLEGTPNRDREEEEEPQLVDVCDPGSQQILVRTLHQRTGGNPLFLVALVNDLIAHHVLVQTQQRWELQTDHAMADTLVPDTIRHLVARQSGRLSLTEQAALAAASVAGMEFCAASVAAAVAVDTVSVEHTCEQLAYRQQFIQRLGIDEWPDGTLSARYRFLHAVYQQLWHERVSPAQLQAYHLHIGERKEFAYGKRAPEIAGELAMHFEQGRDYRKAVQYLQYAGQQASQRSAYVEAINHLTKGLEVLKTAPDLPDSAQRELTLQSALGTTLMVTKGYTAPEVGRAYTRARELCQQLGDTSQLVPVLRGLTTFHFARAKLQTARDVAEQLLHLAQETPTLTYPLLAAHLALGITLFYQGEFPSALSHLGQSIILYDPQLHRPDQFQFSTADRKVSCLSYAARAMWLLGYPDQARQQVNEALTWARELPHPFSLVFALNAAAWIHSSRREARTVQEHADALITLCREHSFPLFMSAGVFRQGWVLVEQGHGEKGIALMRPDQNPSRATGSRVERPLGLADVAAAYAKVGRVEEGLELLAEALDFADETGAHEWEAELYRLKGELLLMQAREQATGNGQQGSRTDS